MLTEKDCNHIRPPGERRYDFDEEKKSKNTASGDSIDG
jgi:hypothetical protein